MQARPLLAADGGRGPDVDDDGDGQDGEVCQGVAGAPRLIDRGHSLWENGEVSKVNGHGEKRSKWRGRPKYSDFTKRLQVSNYASILRRL